MKIVVFGAAGWLGRAILSNLIGLVYTINLYVRWQCHLR